MKRDPKPEGAVRTEARALRSQQAFRSRQQLRGRPEPRPPQGPARALDATVPAGLPEGTAGAPGPRMAVLPSEELALARGREVLGWGGLGSN